MRKLMFSAFAGILASCLVVMLCATGATAQTRERVLYSFTGANDGGQPQGGMILDGKGNLFGTTAFGGTGFAGTVFELSPNSNGSWTRQTLYNFNTSVGDGFVPYAALILDGRGNLYGTTLGGVLITRVQFSSFHRVAGVLGWKPSYIVLEAAATRTVPSQV